MQGLKELWQKYESGKLQEALEEILITEELRELSAGQEIILTAELDENMYRDVCLELMMTKRKGTKCFHSISWYMTRLCWSELVGNGRTVIIK